MDPRQGKNFSAFLTAFIVIIAVAFGILVWVGQVEPRPVDNIAQPN